MTLHVLNDLHLGANRTGGTTQATAYQLRLDLLEGYARLLEQIETDLLINGDLFDGADVSKRDLLTALRHTQNWLERTGKRLILSTGNHDISSSSLNYSSFQFFGQLLTEQFPEQVLVVAGGQDIGNSMYVLSHVPNQDIFNLEIAKVPPCDYLFLHANYDNKFAVEKDHSLNLSEEQAKALPVKHIVFGHEHKARRALGGKVLIVGNQQVSSVADCLDIEFKRMMRIADDGTHEFIKTWEAAGDYAEMDWRELQDVGRFIRVTGYATAAEASQVVTAISKFRASGKVLVITNAVKVEGVNDAAELALSHEEVTSFNVFEALKEVLTSAEIEKLEKLKEQSC